MTASTSGAIKHMGIKQALHNRDNKGNIVTDARPTNGQTTLDFLGRTGVKVTQDVANAIGNFDVQGFRYAAVTWLVDNNHPLREFETPAFKDMIAYANPEAAAALWVSHRSVSSYIMRLYTHMEPQVIKLLAGAISKIHISFDGWTFNGGKRGFFGVVAHFADAAGIVRDLPIAIPQLTGAHTGLRIAEVVVEILRRFGITADTVGYFVLDNAAANDTAVAHIGRAFHFDATHRRLRCAPHTLNLVGQMIIFGLDNNAYKNSPDEFATEAQYMRDWRKNGPLGVLIDIVHYIRTPTQSDLFREAQRAVNALPHADACKFLEPVKPVVTRWGSYFNAFERAVTLKDAIDRYAGDHIYNQKRDNVYAQSKGNLLPDAPNWMRSDGLRAADWAVITDYMNVLRPLEATDSLQARGKTGGFGAVYEILPQFEAILKLYEAVLQQFESVDFNENGAPEDNVSINLRAAWKKLDCYYKKLDDTPIYYTACCLPPYYKNYCNNSWRDKPSWISQNEVALQQLWASYKPATAQIRHPEASRTSSLRDSIAALVNAEPTNHDEVA
jgi:hypothetical protein